MMEDRKAPAGKQGIVEIYARLGRFSKFTDYEKKMRYELKRLKARLLSLCRLVQGGATFPRS